MAKDSKATKGKKATKTSKVSKSAGKRTKSKAKRKVKHGMVYIQASYNNTIVTATDQEGNVLGWSSAGRVGFAGARKATPFAAQQIVANLMENIKSYGLEEVKIFVKGIGSARESAVRSLNAAGLVITSIKDVTPIPHNGVRAPKRRRV